jgi:hypothetical protein
MGREGGDWIRRGKRRGRSIVPNISVRGQPACPEVYKKYKRKIV